jgi:hypothetical protein
MALEATRLCRAHATSYGDVVPAAVKLNIR